MIRTLTRQRYIAGQGWDEVTEPVVVVAGVEFPSGVVTGLGADHLAHVAGMEHPGGYCQGRARGWWDANDLEYVALYTTAAACFSAAIVMDGWTPTT